MLFILEWRSRHLGKSWISSICDTPRALFQRRDLVRKPAVVAFTSLSDQQDTEKVTPNITIPGQLITYKTWFSKEIKGPVCFLQHVVVLPEMFPQSFFFFFKFSRRCLCWSESTQLWSWLFGLCLLPGDPEAQQSFSFKWKESFLFTTHDSSCIKFNMAFFFLIPHPTNCKKKDKSTLRQVPFPWVRVFTSHFLTWGTF